MPHFSVFQNLTHYDDDGCSATDSAIIDEGLSLRDAVREVLRTRTNLVDGVEAIYPDSWPAHRVRWITVHNAAEYETGTRESRTLHLPATITPASSRRIARLVGA